MRRLISIGFVIMIFFQSSSQLWTLAAFYLQKTYISHHLCINRFERMPICGGRCYLKKQLEKQEKQERNNCCMQENMASLFIQEEWQLTDPVISEKFSAIQPVYTTQVYGRDPLRGVFHPPKG